MATNQVVHAKSALHEEIKLSSLVEEIHKRMRNTSFAVSTTSRLEIIEEACTRMATSGHTNKFIRKSFTKWLTNYVERVRKRRLPTSDPSYCPLRHGKDWKKMDRDRIKALKKITWYPEMNDNDSRMIGTNRRKKKVLKAGNIRTTTSIFVHSNMGGLLREREDIMSDLTGSK